MEASSSFVLDLTK